MKKSPLSLSELLRVYREMLDYHHCGTGFMVLIATLFALSLLSGIHTPVQSRVFVAGEIADADIVAHRDLMMEDAQASRTQRDRVAAQQPMVFDLSTAEGANLREQVFSIVKQINIFSSEERINADELAHVLSTQLGAEISARDAEWLSNQQVQSFIINLALPWFEKRLAEGVVVDSRQTLPQRGGILIRNLESGEESLRTDVTHVQDIPVLLAQFSRVMREDPRITRQSQHAVDMLFSLLLKPSLTINREATKNLVAAVLDTVKPVFYHVQKGELVVYKGERISREAQLKLQALYRQADGYVHGRTVAGLFTLSVVLSFGLFMAPSGKRGTPLRCKDLLLISLLLVLFALLAKGLYILAGQLVDQNQLVLAAYAFPLAGAAGVCTLIFAARRYCVVGLLLALFCTVIMKAGLAAFLFFFLSAMLNTWLVIRAQTRQDVVWSVVPLSMGLLVIGLGCGWLEGLRGGDAFLVLGGIVLCNALVSLFLLFAISPILELTFGYTTRFRLMELMNLEQPLLQELMMTIPGTYHHSLVVANMVEAGAKAVGANSLLCKVAALYHDVGKLAYPDYFIENQLGGPNKHDKLAPAMSALILGSHVKKGTELAQKHRLGLEIESLIRQHHGTGLMRFFYKKAQDLGENPRIEEYCYPGPRPQTREAAIIMLADVVEASSRTMLDPTPARIRTHIDTIMKGIFADGQLDESELTFKDLHLLAECFGRILTGIFHQRIAYPDMIKKTDTTSTELGEGDAAAKQAEKSGKTKSPDETPPAPPVAMQQLSEADKAAAIEGS